MAYATLAFASTVSVAQKLKDIVKVVTGAATSVGQLEFATQAASEIINTEPAGWTLADAASALEVSGTATKTEYRVSAPCVDSSKTKFAALSLRDRSFNNNQTTLTVPRPTASGTSGVMYIPIGTGTSGTALQNLCGEPLTMTDVSGTSAWSFTALHMGTAGTTYYISVSARKLVVVAPSNQATGNFSTFMVLEFPETPATVSYNNIPFAQLQYYNPRTANTGDYDFDSIGSGQTGAENAVYRGVGFTNWYRSTTFTRVSRFTDTEFTSDFVFFPTVPAVVTNPVGGGSLYPLLPIIDIRSAYGEGIHYYSSLTDVYYTATGITGDTITVGGDTYVICTLGGSRSICLKKA